MGKIKRFFSNILYSLPFAMKGGEKAISSESNKDDGITISKEVEDTRVGKHLLKGEITQAVEELRYRTYKVSNESENYKYLGGGVAVKDEKVSVNKKKIKFSQQNELLCASILEEFAHMDAYGVENYRVQISYDHIVRFKIEKYLKSIEVLIDNDDKTIRTSLHFSSYVDSYDPTSRPFLNELSSLIGLTNEYAISRNEIASSIKSISFTTYKASNEDDLVSYCFLGDKKFKSVVKGDGEIILSFEWSAYTRIPMDLESKYYSKEMDEKYKNKERKEVAPSIANMERKRYCSVCGKELSVYDGDIMEYNEGEVICQDCLNEIRKVKVL